MKKCIFIIAIFLMLPRAADACTPCQKTWSMEQMVAESGAIIIGKRIDKNVSEKYEQGPEHITILVKDVMKSDGQIEVGDEIEVRSWYGICPYGVQMQRYYEAVIFLNKASEGGWFSGPEYESATFKHALCNDEAMELKKKNIIIWDPITRREVKYPLTEFRRVFMNKYSTAPAQ